ncbi:MAG: hypothetical protein R3E02_04165 [Blastomonas sp.]
MPVKKRLKPVKLFPACRDKINVQPIIRKGHAPAIFDMLWLQRQTLRALQRYCRTDMRPARFRHIEPDPKAILRTKHEVDTFCLVSKAPDFIPFILIQRVNLTIRLKGAAFALVDMLNDGAGFVQNDAETIA